MEEKIIREKKIIRTSIIGIIANVFLAGFKAVVGILSNSIAVTMDAVNNISDAGSGIITIVGTKLAGKSPNKKHPFGYGRVEYMSAMIISVIVLYAGITSLIESVKKIINPEEPSYTTVSLIIIIVAVAVKIVMGLYIKSTGKKVNSDSLINAGQDSLLDAIISASTVLAAVIYIVWGLSLEAWLGAIISLVIIKSGFDMLFETISKLLGERNDKKLAIAIKKDVLEFEEVQGAYDLVLNNYGPETWNGSIHIEVPDTYSANQLDCLLRRIQTKVYEDYQVVLTAIGVYSINTTDEEAIKVREDVRSIVLGFEHVRQMHGFYLDKERSTIRFDMVISFDAEDRRAVCADVVAAVKAKYPTYELQVAMDTDFSEE